MTLDDYYKFLRAVPERQSRGTTAEGEIPSRSIYYENFS